MISWAPAAIIIDNDNDDDDVKHFSFIEQTIQDNKHTKLRQTIFFKGSIFFHLFDLHVHFLQFFQLLIKVDRIFNIAVGIDDNGDNIFDQILLLHKPAVFGEPVQIAYHLRLHDF